jgi:hypothetical protein
MAQGGLISVALFSLYVSEMPTPLQDVELALYTDVMAMKVTSRPPRLLVSYVETPQQHSTVSDRMEIRHKRFQELSHIRTSWSALHSLSGEPIKWVYTTRYLGVTQDNRLSLSLQIDQVRRKTAQSMSWLVPPEQEE